MDRISQTRRCPKQNSSILFQSLMPLFSTTHEMWTQLSTTHSFHMERWATTRCQLPIQMVACWVGHSVTGAQSRNSQRLVGRPTKHQNIAQPPGHLSKYRALCIGTHHSKENTHHPQASPWKVGCSSSQDPIAKNWLFEILMQPRSTNALDQIWKSLSVTTVWPTCYTRSAWCAFTWKHDLTLDSCGTMS